MGRALKKVLAFIFRATPVWITRLLLRAVNPSFRIGCAGVFFTPAGDVLVQRHVYRHKYPWGLPAGFLHAGEAPEDGVLRELFEEVGLRASVDGIVGCYFIHPLHLEVAVRGTIDPAQPPCLSHEIFELAYVKPDALPEAMPADQKAMVRKAAGAPVIKTLFP